MKSNWPELWNRIKKHQYFSWGIYVALALIMFAVTVSGVMPRKLDVKLHDIAKTDIQSPVEVIDQQATDELRKEAVASTPTSFVYQKDDAMIQVEKTDDIFNAIEAVRGDNGKEATPKTKGNDSSSTTDQNSSKPLTMDDKIKHVRAQLAETANDDLSDQTLESLINASDNQLSVAKEITSTAIYDSMNNKIKWGELEKVQNEAIHSIPSAQVDPPVQKAIADLLKYAIVPNYVLDTQTTERNRDEAYKSVDNVVIRQGEVIVKKDQLITQDVIRKLKLVGLLDDQFNPLPFLGLAVLVAFLTAAIIFELNKIVRTKAKASGLLLMYTIIFTVTLLLLKVGSLLTAINLVGIRYIVPVAAGTMMIKILLNERLAVISSFVFAVCGSLMFQSGMASGIFDFQMGVYLTLTGLAGALIVQRYHDKPKILQSGILVSLLNILIMLCLILIKNGNFHLYEASLQIGFAVLSGFISTVLTLGMVPFFEAAFGILSTTKLIELSNPNNALLRKLLTEAPGTYHHSIMVANLAERACEEIGANGLLARVAAYYHDLGKTKRPQFFIENQFNEENPHDKISPQLSRTIIISHPYDGAKMLREHKLPKEIIDIAESHHGTTLLKFFYHKATENSDQPIPETDFRYPGPKVQTKEAAVIELADSVEAAVRSLRKPTPVKIENLVQKILNDRLEDGQFDECDLTIKELYTIKKSICETLNGIFHSRIEYPEEITKKVNNG